MSDTEANQSARYFRAPLETAKAIKDETGDPDALAAWLVMRRFTYGHKRELTCTGAKKIGSALGISRPRADRIIKSLLALRFGENGEGMALVTAKDWNAATNQKVALMKALAPVYVSPETGQELAYLPDLLIPPGKARSPLADLCSIDPRLGLDALHLLLLAHHAIACADSVGASHHTFAHEEWTVEADETGDDFLGHLGQCRGVHYWLCAPKGGSVCPDIAIQSLTGTRGDDAARRYWKALDTLLARGFLCRIAIVSDARDRLLYPLHVFGEGNQRRLEGMGISGSMAKVLARSADRAGLILPEVRFDSDGSKRPDLFIVATPSASPPTVRTVYSPTVIAPTPENLAGLESVAGLCAVWG